jgi:hypothetical protein
MGRGVKLSDTNKKWNRPEKARSWDRTVDTRAERERILIVCEGEKTEPNYFEAIKKKLPPRVAEVRIHGEGANTLTLVDTACELRDVRAGGDYQFDQVWVVFDRDSFPADDFDNAIARAEARGMKCAWSNEAFELWYILHFEYRNTEMPRGDYQRKLDTLLQEHYRKNAPDMYDKLAVLGNQKLFSHALS